MAGSIMVADANTTPEPFYANGRSRLVSLIMPVWRPRLDWLTQAIRSALGQRTCEIELIVVDDGCPIHIADLLDELPDDRLRVVRIPHGGPYRARNAAMSIVQGDYVRFIDSDDAFHPDSTARLLHLMGDEEEAITYGATLFCNQELQPL